MRPKLADRIDAALAGHAMSFYDLAVALYPDGKSHRYQASGGPPGCYMALSAGLRRGGFAVDTSNGFAPQHRLVRPRRQADPALWRQSM